MAHIVKCKFCNIEDSKKREAHLKSTEEGLEKERERHRDKYFRLGYREKHKPSPDKRKQARDRSIKKYPEKHKAKNMCKRITRVFKNNHFQRSYRYLPFHHSKNDVCSLSPITHHHLALRRQVLQMFRLNGLSLQYQLHSQSY